MATSEELEWKKANGHPLRRALPMLCGVIVAAVLGVGAFAGVSALGGASQKEQERIEASGMRQYCYDGHTYHQGTCNQGTVGAMMLAAPAFAALVGFAIGFALGGGKISSRYFQGLNQLGR